MNLGATLKNMVHDEIASRIAAATRSNDDAVAVPGLEESGVEACKPIPVCTMAKEGKDIHVKLTDGYAPGDIYAAPLPPSEWSPKPIAQPEARNSEEAHFTMGTPCASLEQVYVNEVEFVRARPANDNYITLRAILDAAFNHAATGKGNERHARDLPFDKQPMLETTRLVGPGFPLGQAIKKAGEAAGMIERGEIGAAEAECLGAINYLAGAVAWMREQRAAPTSVGAAH